MLQCGGDVSFAGRQTIGTHPSAPNPPPALRIDGPTFDRVRAHLAAAAPCEAVGLLAVADDPGGAIAHVTAFYPGTNVDASPTRYTMDPAEVLAALRDIEARGWRLGAIVHSHPTTPPVPSATDLTEAHYPDALLLIVGLAHAPPETRAWRIVAATGGRGTAVEVPILVDRDGGERGGLGVDTRPGGNMARSEAAARSSGPGV